MDFMEGPPIVIDGQETRRCPNRPLLDFPVFFNEFFSALNWAQKGFLLDSGGILDQSNAFVEGFTIIENVREEARKIREAKEDQLSRRKQGK